MAINSILLIFIIGLLILFSPFFQTGEAEGEKNEVFLQEALNTLVRRIQSEVEVLRGLKFKEQVVAELASDEEIRDYLEGTLDEELALKPETDYNAILKFFGYIQNELNLRDTYLALYKEQAAGFYDERKRRLFITKNFLRGDDILARTIIAHELCHALQDQYFNLHSLLETRRNNDDQLLALMAVVEGDATILMNDYMEKNFSLKTLLSWFKTFTYDQEAFLATPYFIQQSLVFPYIQGSAFVNQALLCSGLNGRNSLFRSPPESSEQILHPERYFVETKYDAPTTFTLADFSGRLAGGWQLSIQNNIGELMLRALFEQNDMRLSAFEAAAGWDGDWFHLYRRQQKGKGDCLLIWRSIWDSAKDAEEFFREFSRLQLKLYPQAKSTKVANSLVFSTPSLSGKIILHAPYVDFLITNAEASVLQLVEEPINKPGARSLKN